MVEARLYRAENVEGHSNQGNYLNVASFSERMIGSKSEMNVEGRR